MHLYCIARAAAGLRSTAARPPLIRISSGQYRDYIETQLRLFAEGRRGGTPYAHIMESIAGRLTAEPRADAAAYYAAAGPE